MQKYVINYPTTREKHKVLIKTCPEGIKKMCERISTK